MSIPHISTAAAYPLLPTQVVKGGSGAIDSLDDDSSAILSEYPDRAWSKDSTGAVEDTLATVPLAKDTVALREQFPGMAWGKEEK